ncbi:GntR family transcriptional regulator [Intrasporangium calvum]|uniref:GntR family transcriptional regulator n=1 Tax=Intrasporangium calvum TaxID=53358 RepID=UPI000DF5D1E9|nr:GntR family transcriptional regulator [Intrasporangium calvum]AXG12141.1 GntR family transcriptional regulator [Intrasporangium calvum]
MSLDPDDPRPPYQQVAASLRAAILTRKFAPGDKLPSQMELGRHYGVARMTVQQALRILKDEGLIVSRQGSGVFARARTEKPIGLRPHIERAFEQPHVEIDFSGYTAETLHGIIAEPLDKIRSGRLTPQSIRIRMLLSDMNRPLSLPIRTDGDVEASGPVRQRMADISARHAGAIEATVEELCDLGLVPECSIETRLHGSSPLFKVYIVNKTDAFFGYYPVVKHDVRIGGKKQAIYDPMGKDAVLFQRTDDGDPDSTDSQFVTQTRQWFDSVWNTIATPKQP